MRKKKGKGKEERERQERLDMPRKFDSAGDGGFEDREGNMREEKRKPREKEKEERMFSPLGPTTGDEPRRCYDNRN